jgi:DNA/RNA endonuclease G (NUC1)
MTSNCLYSDPRASMQKSSTVLSEGKNIVKWGVAIFLMIVIGIGIFLISKMQGSQQLNTTHQTTKRSLQELINGSHQYPNETNHWDLQSHQKTSQRCRIIQKDIVRPYPNGLDRAYYIAFNQTTMQPIFVKYIQPYFTNSCTTCKHFKNDPYGIDQLSHEDYPETGYDRGHLVPSADYGADTYIITNAVPMLPRFNRGIWRLSEEMIRDKYKGRLIYKGCEYMGKTIVTGKNNLLYIPSGCTYVVFDSNDVDQISGLELLDYGYLKNNNRVQELSSTIKKLPDWVECTNNNVFTSLETNVNQSNESNHVDEEDINQNSNNEIETQYQDDSQQADSQQADSQQNDSQQNDSQQNDSQRNDSQQNDSQQTDSQQPDDFVNYGSGDYRLSPEDYHYADHIIVEIWGAGGSGGADVATADMNSIDTNSNNIIGGGGGSGAYIKASIQTNQQYIDVHVGYGGARVERYTWTPGLYPICMRKHTCINTSVFTRSGDSWIRIRDDNNNHNVDNETYLVDLTAGGGMDGGSCTDRYSIHGGGGGGGVVTIKNTSDIYAVPGNSGIDGMNGASAPFGGNGGNTTHRNGHVPGGGGGAVSVCPRYPRTAQRMSRGGDGMIKIFFIK